MKRKVMLFLFAGLLTRQIEAESGHFSLNLRYRIEWVSQEGFAKDAIASTVRTTLDYKTRSFKGVYAFIQLENISALPNDSSYNSKLNGNTDYPVVADPELTEVNQFYVGFKNEKLDLRLGRILITVGDHRYIGNVGWRQNDQTYDGINFIYSIGRVSLNYGYIDDVNNILGKELPSAHHFLFAGIKLGKVEVTPYSVLLNWEKSSVLNSFTYGIEVKGRVRKIFTYEAEFARQIDKGDNPKNFSHNYIFVQGIYSFSNFSVGADYELLEGNGQTSFSTPLATLHKWDGWADMFLVTPPDGLQVGSIFFKGKTKKVSWLVRVLDFKSKVDSYSYGKEIDALLGIKVKGQTVFFKFAKYIEDNYGKNTTKLMSWISWGVKK